MQHLCTSLDKHMQLCQLRRPKLHNLVRAGCLSAPYTAVPQGYQQ
jgi:hypothetical protein